MTGLTLNGSQPAHAMVVHAMSDDFAGRLRSFMAERRLGVLAVARRVPCDKALISRLAAGRVSVVQGRR